MASGTDVSRVGRVAVENTHTTRAGWPSDPMSARSRSSTSCTGPPRASRWTKPSSGGRDGGDERLGGQDPGRERLLDHVLALGQELAELAPAARGLKPARVLQALVLG